MSPKHKPMIWLGDSHKRLVNFPLDVRKVMGFALRLAQAGEKHTDAKPLKGFGGAGTLEVIEDHDGDAFRAVYTVKFNDVVYALHSFKKKSKHGIKTPKEDMDMVRKRYAEASQRYDDWKNGRRDEP